MNDQTILGKDTVKDLGVHFSDTGKITKLVGEGRKLSRYILRTFQTREIGAMVTLLKALIITKLEYACIVWSPTEDKKLIRLIESVQRRFTSRISLFNEYDEELGRLICKVDYWRRLKELKIFSLERRRERYMILYMYKIIIGLCPNPGFNSENPFPYNERTGFSVKGKINRKAEGWVQKLRNTSLFVAGPTLFNRLPSSLRKFEIPDNPTKTHVEEFKKKLDEYLWHIPDQPDVNGLVRAAETNSLVHQMKYYF